MRRAILFLIFALFLAMVIQPNLNKQIKEKSKIDVPEQTDSTIITNDTVDNSRCKSKAVICIDASHGGSDAGYTSDGHTSEKDLNLIIPYGVATLIYLGFFFYNMYLGIYRITTYPQKLKHYKNLTKVFEKKGYDPTIEYYLTTICDREVSKQLREDFNVKD